MKTCLLLLLLAILPAIVRCEHSEDVLSHPAFTTVLKDDAYTLSWDFDLEKEAIFFTVTVRTTGWVGFGISPDGGMANSDVVIGWVDDSGNAFLQDRYADSETRPPVDAQQDWFLISGEESDNFTILRFSRNFTTCDNRDREIKPQTQRIIYSWSGSDMDPPNNDPNAVAYHGATSRGSASLNLLGGLPDPPPEPDDAQSFLLGVTNITIPGDRDTTYWCLAIELPEEVLSGTHYIYKYAPEIHPDSAAHVHHITIYQCTGLANISPGSSAPCFGEVASINPLEECIGTSSLGGWAVGGGEFLFPEDVSYRVSGPGRGRYIVMEMHYDNPELLSGVVDNSGIRFFYTARRTTFTAAQFVIGAAADQTVIIPPNAENFTVLSRCPIGCTEQNIPETGIKIFANLFHTHLVGHGLVLEHYRMNQECGVLEELQPIDINLQYDFNYQQIITLPREVTVLPGDVLILKCFYGTKGRKNVTLGGEGTRDEMCFSFVYFYPDTSTMIDASSFSCGSSPVEVSYDAFINTSVPSNLQDEFRGITKRIYSQDPRVPRPTRQEVKETFNKLEWTPEQTEGLENALVSQYVYSACIGNQSGLVFEVLPADPGASCNYQAPDVCTGQTPVPCCERLSAADSAIKLAMNILPFVAVVGLATFFKLQ